MLFTTALLWELELNRRRRKLITSGTTPASRKNLAHSDRTTKVLIILLLIFLCTEFPQGLFFYLNFILIYFFYSILVISIFYFLGILAILNGIFPNDVHQFVYLSLGEFLDLLSLINCNTCFVVYPLISTQYRETLKGFIKKIRYKFYYCRIMQIIFRIEVTKHAKLQSGSCYCLGTKKLCKYCRHYKHQNGNGQSSRSRLLSPNTYNNNVSIYTNSNNASSYFISAPSTPDLCVTPQPSAILTPTSSNAATEPIVARSNSRISDHFKDSDNHDASGNNTKVNHTESTMNTIKTSSDATLPFLTESTNLNLTTNLKTQSKHQLLLISKSLTVTNPVNNTTSLRFLNDIDVLL